MPSRDSVTSCPSTRPPNKRSFSIVSRPTNDSMTTLDDSTCHKTHSEDPSRKRRKSVTFSAVTLVVSVPRAKDQNDVPVKPDAPRYRRVPLASSPADPPPFLMPSPDSQVFHVSTNKDHTRPPRDSMKPATVAEAMSDAYGCIQENLHVHGSPSSPRKPKFFTVAPPPDQPLPDIVTQEEQSPSFCRRRLSVLPPQPNHHPQFSNKPTSDIFHATSDHSSPKRKPSIIRPPVHVPPANVCTAVNHRIRSALGYPSFDFSQHVRHRTYVVRALPVAAPHGCVTMLDAGVDSLLPSIFPLPPPCNQGNFVIRKAGTKGLGLFAERSIRCNELVLVEHPVVVTPYVIGLSVPLAELYADIFRRLSDNVLQELTELLPPGSCNDKEKDVYEAIMRVNALAISLPVPQEDFAELNTHRGVFLKTSRCNHSCGPNAKWEWDEKSFCLILTAVRQINPGDEITIAYVSPQMPFQARREALLEMYSFECLCPHCVQPKYVVQQSDITRQAISTFWETKTDDSHSKSELPTFENWCLDPSIPSDVLLTAHLRALNDIRDEGLEIFDTHPGPGRRAHPSRDVGRHMDAIAMCYGALGDADNFQIWISKAAEGREKDRPEQKLAFRKWLSNPMSFPVWGWRKACCAGAGASANGRGRDRAAEGEAVGLEADGSADGGLAACVKMGMFEFL